MRKNRHGEWRNIENKGKIDTEQEGKEPLLRKRDVSHREKHKDTKVEDVCELNLFWQLVNSPLGWTNPRAVLSHTSRSLYRNVMYNIHSILSSIQHCALQRNIDTTFLSMVFPQKIPCGSPWLKPYCYIEDEFEIRRYVFGFAGTPRYGID
jgi:hypothetical protein